jgi:hypothetical protein
MANTALEGAGEAGELRTLREAGKAPGLGPKVKVVREALAGTKSRTEAKEQAQALLQVVQTVQEAGVEIESPATSTTQRVEQLASKPNPAVQTAQRHWKR